MAKANHRTISPTQMNPYKLYRSFAALLAQALVADRLLYRSWTIKRNELYNAWQLNKLGFLIQNMSHPVNLSFSLSVRRSSSFENPELFPANLQSCWRSSLSLLTYQYNSMSLYRHTQNKLQLSVSKHEMPLFLTDFGVHFRIFKLILCTQPSA
jgi:hypothetical protein